MKVWIVLIFMIVLTCGAFNQHKFKNDPAYGKRNAQISSFIQVSKYLRKNDVVNRKLETRTIKTKILTGERRSKLKEQELSFYGRWEDNPQALTHYGSKSFPARSCGDIYIYRKDPISGNYWIKTQRGKLIEITCKFPSNDWSGELTPGNLKTILKNTSSIHHIEGLPLNYYFSPNKQLSDGLTATHAPSNAMQTDNPYGISSDPPTKRAKYTLTTPARRTFKPTTFTSITTARTAATTTPMTTPTTTTTSTSTTTSTKASTAINASTTTSTETTLTTSTTIESTTPSTTAKPSTISSTSTTASTTISSNTTSKSTTLSTTSTKSSTKPSTAASTTTTTKSTTSKPTTSTSTIATEKSSTSTPKTSTTPKSTKKTTPSNTTTTTKKPKTTTKTTKKPKTTTTTTTTSTTTTTTSTTTTPTTTTSSTPPTSSTNFPTPEPITATTPFPIPP